MSGLIIAAASLAAWLLASRWLFRRWVRNDTLSNKDEKCSHGYQVAHAGESCHGRHPASHGAVAAAAGLAALFLPVTLCAFFVMHNPPMSNRELREKTEALEEENAKLRALREAQP